LYESFSSPPGAVCIRRKEFVERGFNLLKGMLFALLFSKQYPTGDSLFAGNKGPLNAPSMPRFVPNKAQFVGWNAAVNVAASSVPSSFANKCVLRCIFESTSSRIN
jgi:hypothetical protein